MGAHQVGRLHMGSSGYEGKWVGNQETMFDNEYYQLMIATNVTWENIVGTYLSNSLSVCLSVCLFVRALLKKTHISFKNHSQTMFSSTPPI